MTQAQRSNDTDIYLAPQPVAGSAGTPTFSRFETTSGRLGRTVGYVKSQTIKSDGQSTDNIRDNITHGSELAFEVSKDIKQILPSALRINAAVSLEVVTSTTISFDTSTNRILDSANGLANFSDEAFVFVSGSSNSDLNREYYVTASTAGALTVKSGQIAADAVAGDNITIKVATYRSGSTANYLVAQERETSSGGTLYTSQIDNIVNTLSITVPTTGVVTGTLGLVAGQQLTGTSQISGQTDTSVPNPANRPLSNLDMTWLPDQDRQTAAQFTDFNLDISSNSEAIQAAGIEGAVCNTINTITAGGSLNSITLLSDPRAEKLKQENGTRFSMSYKFEFSDGEFMIITTRKMVYTECSRERTTDTAANFSGTYDAETGDNNATVQFDLSF